MAHSKIGFITSGGGGNPTGGLFNMPPPLPFYYSGNCHTVNVKKFSKRREVVFSSFVKHPDASNLIIQQDRRAVLFTSGKSPTENPTGVEVILALCNIAKIGKSVVLLISVFVVHLLAIWAYSRKGFHNYPVNRVGDFRTILAQLYTGISNAARPKYLLWSKPIKGIVSLKASNPSHVANLVESLVARNVTPLFVCVAIWVIIIVSHFATSVGDLIREACGISSTHASRYYTTNVGRG